MWQQRGACAWPAAVRGAALLLRLDAMLQASLPRRCCPKLRCNLRPNLLFPTAGGATLRGGQLKALNQSVSTQVAQLMQVS